jgi:multisite-specific tRNA:(cytosine-C5)-methyltransferase
VFPHQQDTGGFFITVIQKVTEMPPIPEDEESSKRKNRRRAPDAASATTDAPAEEAADAAKGKEKVEGEEGSNESKAELKADAAGMDLEGEEEQEQEEEEADDAGLEEVEDTANKGKDLRRRRHNQGNREEPYLPLSSTLTAEWELVKYALLRARACLCYYLAHRWACDDDREYFGLKETFPELQLMARGEGSPRIYFLSSAVSDVLWKNTSRFSKVRHGRHDSAASILSRCRFMITESVDWFLVLRAGSEHRHPHAGKARTAQRQVPLSPVPGGSRVDLSLHDQEACHRHL